MSLRVAFDLDGVLADLEGKLARRADRLFGRSATPRSLGGTSAVTDLIRASAMAWMGRLIGRSAVDPMSHAAAQPDRALALAGLRLTSRQGRRLWRRTEATHDFWETLNEADARSVLVRRTSGNPILAAQWQGIEVVDECLTLLSRADESATEASRA